MLLVDTGVFVAAAARRHPQHRLCRDLLDSGRTLVTTAMVIAESVYLIADRIGPAAEPFFYDSVIEGSVQVESMSIGDWRRVRDLVERYQDLPLGGTDASVVAIAERLGLSEVATLDHRHFRVVRPAHCSSFELVP